MSSTTFFERVKATHGLMSIAMVATVVGMVMVIGFVWMKSTFFAPPPQQTVTVTRIVRSQGYTGGLFNASVPSELISLSNGHTLNVLIASQPWIVTVRRGSRVVYYSRSDSIQQVHEMAPNTQYLHWYKNQILNPVVSQLR